MQRDAGNGKKEFGGLSTRMMLWRLIGWYMSLPTGIDLSRHYETNCDQQRCLECVAISRSSTSKYKEKVRARVRGCSCGCRCAYVEVEAGFEILAAIV